MKAVKLNRTDELVQNIKKYIELTGSDTFIYSDINGELAYSIVSPVLQRMRKRGMISIVSTIKQGNVVVNVFKPIDLTVQPRSRNPPPPEPTDCLGWREYFPEMFSAPNLTGTTRIINRTDNGLV